MKKLSTIIFILLVQLGFAQVNNTEYTITGKVIDPSNEAIAFVNVVLKSFENDSILTGATTDIEGEYIIQSDRKNAYLEISFVGYETLKFDNIDFGQPRIQIPNITLLENGNVMESIEVVGEKSTTEFKLDKRVFNVGKDLTTSGSSALEVLNNVPSVNVSIEGDITLRGASGVQILVNGKPSVLSDDEGGALGTITADMISQIEVITNPSAKYEAEGSSGIINIILKKDEKKGINGSISINTGTPHNHSIGASFNRRGDKFNIFSQLGVGYRSLPRDNKNINENRITNRSLVSEGTNFRNELFYNFILGTDYYLTKQDVITLSGSVAYEVEKQPSETEYSRFEVDEEIERWERIEETEATNPKLQYELKYKRDFKDHKKHDLNFSFIGNFFGKDQSSFFQHNVLFGVTDIANQKTATEFKESRNTLNLDYVKPINDQIMIETGLQYTLNEVSNEYEVQNETESGFVTDTRLTNTFEYDQNVLGVYATGAYETGKWGIKLGARLEQTDLKTLLVNTNQNNSQKFINLFPSAHTSYKINDRISLQAGYSRRIYRPRLWDLNPFFNISDNFNIRTGNPNLLPQFTDSYEFGSIFTFDKISFNINVYDRYTTQVIERISIFEDGVRNTSPSNLGTRNILGTELNFKYSLSKKVSFNGDIFYNIFDRKGEFEGQNFDFSGDEWQSKLTAKFKINKKLNVEVSGNYQSRAITLQGMRSGNVFSNIGLRYKILKGKGIFNISVRDIFASRIRENTADLGDSYLYSFGQRGRFITMGFSYGFGKGEAMQYSGGRRR